MKSKLAAATLVVGGVFAWLILRRLRRQRQLEAPGRIGWHRVGVVKQLSVYPLKSAAALHLAQAQLDNYGMSSSQGLRDRCLIVYSEEEEKVQIWAGSHPKMLSIGAQLLADQSLLLTAPNAIAQHVDVAAIVASGQKPEMEWEIFSLIACEEEHHRWISQVLLQQEQGLRLYVALNANNSKFQGQSEFFPIMVLHDKSVADLNARLSPADCADERQFRANFVVTSDEHVAAYDEDDWLQMRVGDQTILNFAAPCLRCILPNINVESCERNRNFEPLRTLKTYRLRSHPREPEMGVYFEVNQAGSICVGDAVYVQYKS